MSTTHTTKDPAATFYIYAVVIPADEAKFGFPAGDWMRLCYMATAREVVARLLRVDGIRAVICERQYWTATEGLASAYTHPHLHSLPIMFDGR